MSTRFRAAALASATALLLAGAAGVAAAHGSATDPPSRNYGCWDRWGDDFQNPAMATEDPMCWQAWQANPNAMWNWNGLYRENLNGDHQGNIPDGTLCSGGHAEGGRYDALDAVGDWTAADKPNDFSVTVHDQALHGGDYYRVYITKQGFDPLTEPLGWGDLELVKEVGKTAPATNTVIDVDAGSRSGRHIVYTIWQASHLDQSYYFCSDVNFTG
ncbi:lytic polysaccharide monooxygenase auxiliary activity family 9 protein [Amycolatopsis albispora]|uniref:Cellulose-binding protein n=1 Tax=Amycolatopsis albispora TaxID=1804986 RepID=A0A344L2E9_9PSEU|nr:lytic polysaccharide monooxygenase auxiliary activity family 9 protein [Amycolatopsis albispora]AXB42223.1 cellulose-binding protein [Amycolatopsis albispora]